MSKDEIFEATKSVFENWEKENAIKYLSTILSEFLSNGVSISACEIEPPYTISQHNFSLKPKMENINPWKK